MEVEKRGGLGGRRHCSGEVTLSRPESVSEQSEGHSESSLRGNSTVHLSQEDELVASLCARILHLPRLVPIRSSKERESTKDWMRKERGRIFQVCLMDVCLSPYSRSSISRQYCGSVREATRPNYTIGNVYEDSVGSVAIVERFLRPLSYGFHPLNRGKIPFQCTHCNEKMWHLYSSKYADLIVKRFTAKRRLRERLHHIIDHSFCY